jgi:pimeloyl-ACP methyl ester carboxylesterase
VSRTVEFRSEGERIEALLFLPDDGRSRLPIVVMGGGWCYVKELVQPQHAEVFNAAGLAALVFDYRHMGGSSGEPRQHIDPWRQIEDYKNAISYVETLPEIDSQRIGVWGISYSGGHVLVLAATDPRVRGAVSVVPVVDGFQNLRLAHGTIGFRRVMEMVIEDRRKRFATGEHGYLPHASRTPEVDVPTWPFPDSAPMFEMLRETQAPAYENRATVASTEMLMSYSVFPYVRRILNAPTMMIVAEGDDHTHWDLALNAFNDIPTPNKELFVVPSSTHHTIYKDRSHLEIAAGAGARWFSKHLGGGE